MILVSVEAVVDAPNVDAVIDIFAVHAASVQAMPGCAHYAIYLTHTNDGIVILQHWENIESFNAYRKSPAFAVLGENLRPKLSSRPETIVANTMSGEERLG